MKAAYYTGDRKIVIGPCTPVAPGPGEVSLDVAYCGICGTDVHIYHGAMDARVKMPQIMGHEASATVAEVGEGVRDFAPGDKVVVRPLDNRGETEADRGHSHICRDLKFIGIDSPGAFQSSWNVPAFTLHKLPEGTDMKLAALCEPLAVACHDVRMGEVKPGELAVVIGGGPIGVLVALVAKARGARVVLSEVNEYRIRFARELGLDAVSPVDVDLPEYCWKLSAGSGADIVFEVSGAKAAAATMTDLLAIRGRIVVVAIYPKPAEINLFQFFWKELKLSGARVYEPEDYTQALTYISQKTLPLERMITKVLPLESLSEAFAKLESTPDAMKILIDCGA